MMPQLRVGVKQFQERSGRTAKVNECVRSTPRLAPFSPSGGRDGGEGELSRASGGDWLGGAEYAFPVGGVAGAGVAGQPRHVGMHGLRADNDLHHQKPGNFLLTLHFRDTFQELLVMPLVQVEQVRMEAVFADSARRDDREN